MKHSLTAMLALLSAAGLAGAAHAQSVAPAGTAPAQGMQSTTPSYQYQSNTTQPMGDPNQYPSTSAQSMTPNNQYQGQTTQPMGPMGQYQPGIQSNASMPRGMQQSGTNDFYSRNITRDEIRQVQEQLRAQGLYNGPADGLVGSTTKRAITQFQQRNGLPRTGTLDPQMLAALSGSTANVGAGMPPANQPIAQAPMSAGGNTPNPGLNYNTLNTNYNYPGANYNPATAPR